MGTIIDLRVGNLVVDWGKNEFFRDHRSLFQVKDVRKSRLGEAASGGESVVTTLARPLKEVRPRLELLGYDLTGAEEEYVNLQKQFFNEGDDCPRFQDFLDALKRVNLGTVSRTYDDDHEFGEFFRQEIGPRIDIDDLFSGSDLHTGKWDFAYMMENFDAWYVLVLLAQNPVNLDLPVIWDYEEHLENGWSKQEDFWPRLKPSEVFTLVTEGSSDSKVLQKALAMLEPSVSDFFRFIDMQDGYPFTGSGNLANFCRGLVKLGIQNKLIAIFDNDAEGVSKQMALSSVACPTSMRIIRLPDLQALESVRCSGTSGESLSDINGRAASIEAYLDLTWRVSRPATVRWTNYLPQSGFYQGSLEEKEYYVRLFLDLRDETDGYDLSKLRSVVATLLQAAKLIASQARPASEF